MEFRTTLDTTSKIITGFITVFFLLFLSQNAIKLEHETKNMLTVMATSALLIAIYIYCYGYRPIKYVVNNEGVTITRLFKSVKLDIRNIRQIFPTSKESMEWTLRSFGNGGLFGYFGNFSNPKFGPMTWYATRKNNYVIIEMKDNRTIVLTPDDPEMANEINKILISASSKE